MPPKRGKRCGRILSHTRRLSSNLLAEPTRRSQGGCAHNGAQPQAAPNAVSPLGDQLRRLKIPLIGQPKPVVRKAMSQRATRRSCRLLVHRRMGDQRHDAVEA
jgi:hypothetical protein